jgi:ATP-binding cassette, subfamily C, bacteriocin exporter
MNILKKSRFPTLQHDRSDCGVACLSSIIQFYHGFVAIEKLRELSGTTQQGTTLLGLYQGAQKCGFDTEGGQAGTDYLKTRKNPCIIHVVSDEVLQHYVVCYGFKNGRFSIGDPAVGMVSYSEEQLKAIWQSQCLLELQPNTSFQTRKFISRQKRSWHLLLIRPDLPMLVLIAFLALLFSLSGIAISIFLQQLLDHVLPTANWHKGIFGFCLLTLIFLLRAFINYLRGYLLNLQNREFNDRLIDHFYSSLLFLPRLFFSNRKTGELVARMEDTSRIQATLAFLFGDLVRDVIYTAVSLTFIFYYSVPVGLIVLFFLPILFLTALHYHKRVVHQQREVMKSNAKKTSHYISTLTGIDTVKAYNKEKAFSENNRRIYGMYQEKVFLLGSMGNRLQLSSDIVTILLLISVLGTSSFLVLSKHLTIGELTALVSISSSMLPAIGSLAFANIRLQSARVAFDRMYEFTGIEPEYREEKESRSALTFTDLRLENISFGFPGRKALLKKASLEIRRGKITALKGESGGGKTSLFHLLVRFYPFENGSFLFNGGPIQDIPIPVWRDMIGVVPQEISIFNDTVAGNICFGSTREDLQACSQFCIEYGFDRFFSSFPQRYDTLLGEEGITLSGGQKQMIAIARALYRRPQLLLLDEPTSAMDPDAEKFVMQLLTELKDDTGIFIITHRPKLAEFADFLYILENGIVAKREPIYN